MKKRYTAGLPAHQQTVLRLAFSSFAVLGSGCQVQVDHSANQYSCEVTPECPPGLRCVQGSCVNPGVDPSDPDASPVEDAGAGADDAMPPGEFRTAVASSSDDAEELQATGTVDLVSSDIELVTETDGPQIIGLRFQSIPFERDQLIEEAFIQFTTDETSIVQTDLVLRAQAIADAPTFTATINDISLRQRTTAEVLWSPPPWELIDESEAAQRTPNLAPLIQEVMAGPEWVAGNSIVFIVEGQGARVARAFNIAPEKAAVLVIR